MSEWQARARGTRRTRRPEALPHASDDPVTVAYGGGPVQQRRLTNQLRTGLRAVGGARGPTGVALLVAACLAAAACFGGQSVSSLEVGDCFDDPSTITAEVEEVDAVPCSEPHDNEVYAVVDHPAGSDDPFPGVSVLDSYSWDYCFGEFAAYVGIAYEDSRLGLAYFYPTPDSWEDHNDREIICFLYDFDFRRLRGSMQGSRE